jgi:hypothetical protein
MALPTAEISPTVNLAAAAATFQTRQPLSPATEAASAARKSHALLDGNLLGVAIGDVVA